MLYAVGTQYAVSVSKKKVNSRSGLTKYWWWGPLPLVQKGNCTPHAVDEVGAQYAVGTQYAVDVSAKTSIHTVDLANMCGGDHYL